MEWCWFLAISQDVVQNLKDYISLQLIGCFSLEHIGEKLLPSLWWVLNEYVHVQLEVLGLISQAHLQSKAILSAPGQVKLSGTLPRRTTWRTWRTVGTKYHLGYSFVTWVCKADSVSIQLDD